MFISTDFTILRSSISVKNAIKTLKELEYQTAIISDDKLFGVLDFYYGCKKADIKPVISVQYEVEGAKVILIAKNFEGYRNLSTMSKDEFLTVNSLKELTEGLVVVFQPTNNDLKACLNLKKELEGKAPMYVGITKPFTADEYISSVKLKELKLKEIPCEIATHVKKEDYRTTTAMVAVGEKASFDQIMVQNQVSPENFIKDKHYYNKNYSKESLMNLKEILDSCVDDYKFGDPTPPGFKFTPEIAEKEGLLKSTSEDELFAHLSRKGLDKRLELIDSSKHEEYKARLEYEIEIINNMKFPGYMLIVWDFTRAAKEMDIPVGPGRGSAAGSLVAFSLEITDIDPMPYGLLFERFLNPERISMPDIDMDFCQTRRPEILDYVSEKYGQENVAQIITFGKMGGKASIKDASRIFSYHGADRMSKAIPETPGIKLDEAYSQNETELKEIIESEALAKRTWKFAHKLEGLSRNLGVHAAGLVISNDPVTNKCPIAHVKGTQVVQYEGQYLEDVDLIKFDFLGLKTLSVVDMCVKMVKESKGIDIDFRSMIKYDDPKVFEYISTGDTGGLFQIESSGMQDLCKRLKPDCFEDLVAILALYRPGPMESGMLDDFIARKKGEEEISYFFKDMEKALEPILKPTYGVIVYQEQVMQIVQEIGGFSLGESDIIRRAMGKKQIAYMEEKAIEFAERAEAKGYKKEEAKELFGLIEKFAGYGFNKSHSAAYALVTYYTAFLKTYHPLEFVASLMNLDYDKQEKLITYIKTTKKMGITIEAPNVNTSTEFFSVRDGKIVYGLRAIKSAGENVATVIQKRDKNGEYKDFQDFVRRSKSGKKLNKSALNALLSVGALDSLISRDYIYHIQDSIHKIKTKKHLDEVIQLIDSNLDDESFKAPVLKLETMVLDEKFYLGHIFTSPFRDIQSDLDKFDIPTSDDYIVGKNKAIVWFETMSDQISKKGNRYGNISMIDTCKNMEDALIFAQGLESFEKKNIDITKPLIIDFNLKTEGDIFINDAEQFNRNNLLKSFPAKAKIEKTPVKAEVSISKIKMNDFEALLSIGSEEEIIVTNKNNDSILKIYR